MKVLTVFSAIMLPINLIASIYGMNFRHMPELDWRYGFHFAISLMAVIAMVMLTWFWRRGWLGSRRRNFLRRELHLRRKLRRRRSTA
jgi:magnesium transporter